MGRTPKPLIIVALPPCDGWEELAKLEKQGHTIHRLISGVVSLPDDVLLGADIILAPQAWRMTNAHKTYLLLAVKEARMLRYPTNEKKADSKTRNSVEEEIKGPSENSSND